MVIFNSYVMSNHQRVVPQFNPHKWTETSLIMDDLGDPKGVPPSPRFFTIAAITECGPPDRCHRICPTRNNHLGDLVHSGCWAPYNCRAPNIWRSSPRPWHVQTSSGSSYLLPSRFSLKQITRKRFPGNCLHGYLMYLMEKTWENMRKSLKSLLAGDVMVDSFQPFRWEVYTCISCKDLRNSTREASPTCPVAVEHIFHRVFASLLASL